MKIKELLEKYGDVKINEEKEKEIKKLLGIKENKKWVPNHEEDYFFVSDTLEALYDTWMGSYIDTCRYFKNNCFKTQKEAEFRLEQIKVYNELKNFAIENNDEIDWKNDQQNKYYMYFKCSDILIYDTLTSKDIGQIYFSTRELAEQAIKTVGEDRIKKYLFGVEE